MLTAEQIQENWELLISLIETDKRSTALQTMYNDFQDDLIVAPASGNENYHNCFPGGYIDHVLRVVKCANKLYDVWTDLGADMSGFTKAELIFAAINHDLGKAGDVGKPYYVPNPSEWHKKNQGQLYELNKELSFMKVPDRSLYILQKYQIPVTENEYLAIKLHDGMYTDGNKSYYMAAKPELGLKTNICFILHHADHLAARIEHANMVKPSITAKVTSNTSTSKSRLSSDTLDASSIADLFKSN